MRLAPSLFLALRYLRPRRSIVSIVTLLSVLGPVLGVATLIVVIAVMAGFTKEVQRIIFGLQAHLQLLDPGGDPIEDPMAMVERLQEKGVQATPTVQGPVLVQVNQQIQTKLVKGILPKTDRGLTSISESMVAGQYELMDGQALIGEDMAEELGLGLGDNLVVHATGKLKQMVTIDEYNNLRVDEPDTVYLPMELEIVGIFKLGMYDFDSEFIVTHLDTADELFELPWGSALAIQVWTDDAYNLTPFLQGLAEDPLFVGMGYRTWIQANQHLFQTLEMEKSLQFFLLIIIVIVAGFCIVAMLITIVFQKAHEIGVMKTIGANPLTILSVFLYQGAIVGFLGVTGGTALGMLVVEQRDAIARFLERVLQVEVFPEGLYQLAEIPALVDPMDLINIGATTFIICVLSALIPAAYAAALTPANAFRRGA